MQSNSPSKSKIIAAFLTIYLVWGSTYLAIAQAIKTLPPFLMSGVRFVIAGAILYVWARFRGAEKPSLKHWISAAGVGCLLFVGGNGGVVFAEQTVPTSVAALVIALVPVWMVLLDWVFLGGKRPSLPIVIGLMLGLSGMVVLFRPTLAAEAGAVHPLGAMVLLGASLSWGIGALAMRKLELPRSVILSAGMQTFIGGLVLCGIAAARHEPAAFNPQAVSVHSLLAMGYLILFGSFAGMTTYVWLLRTCSVEMVATHGFVNPIVAVFLGCILAHEPFTAHVWVSAGLIIAGVTLIIAERIVQKRQPQYSEPQPLESPIGALSVESP